MEELLQWVIRYSKTFAITDIIDIAIIAYIVYHVLLLVRRSRAAQVAKAILLLLVALGVSFLLQLKVINFILSRTMELGMLALIIVFQPEIRRFLEQIGSSRLGNFFGREAAPAAMEDAIMHTVQAFTVFARDKVGALMVFERKNLLDDFVKTGTPLDASVSAELLGNIFWNKAPLHDGAVIVRGGRIAGAGCVLPLSGNTNLSRELGTRHRAGIGMSESSDAVVAIVSEETGTISVAVGGMLKRHLAPETLERLLRNELLSDETQEKQTILSSIFKPKKGEKDDGEKTR